MPTNPPANPLPGAVYVDQSTNISWVWTGTYWLQAHGGSQNYSSQVTPTTSIVPGYYSQPSPDSWFPFVGATAPPSPACGQIWIDNSVDPNYAQVWDCNTSTWIQLGGIPGGDTNSIVSVATPLKRLSGEDLVSGDLWLNPSYHSMSYWNGGGWVPVASSDTHSIYSTGAPGFRLNNDPLLAGDLWVEPNTGKIEYWTGSDWKPITAVDADHQLSASNPLYRPDGTDLIVADLYTNTVSQTLFYWDGADWKRYNDTHSFHDTATPLKRPDGSDLAGGDQWFNPTTDKLYVRDATTNTWILVTTSDTHSIWRATSPGLRDDSTSLQVGDMWVNSVADNYGCYELKVWNGGDWKCVGEKDTHAFLGAGPTGPGARGDGRPLIDGDIYIDTVSQQGYYYNTATLSWVSFGTDTHSWLSTGDPNAPAHPLYTNRPNGTVLTDGDVYIDTATNQGYYYNSSNPVGQKWTLFGSDTHAFADDGDPNTNPVYNSGLRPNLTPLEEGDEYIDRLTNQGYYYNKTTTTWKLFASDTHSILGTGNPNPGFTQRLDGSPLQDGDQFIDTSANQGYYYNTATLSWKLFGANTNSFINSGTPFIVGGSNTQATRPDLSALQLGDQYLDTDTNTLYTYTGVDWVEVSKDTHSFVDAVAPTQRQDGSALQTGDKWVNPLYNPTIGYTRISGAWIPDGDVSVVAALPTTGEHTNQLLVNSTNNKMYRWDTSNGPGNEIWVQVA